MADANARRPDRRHLHRPHDRAGGSPRPAAPDRAPSSRCREQELHHDRRRRFRIRDQRRRSSRTSCAWSRTCWIENLQHVRTIRMWRGEFGSHATVRHRPGHVVRRLQRVGRNDLLHDAGLEIPRAHLRSAHRLPGREQHPAAAQSGRDTQAREQAPVRRLPRLRYRRLGRDRQGDDREGHRRRALARVRATGRLRILRRGRRRFHASCCAQCCAAAADFRPPASSTCCTGRTTARSPSPKFKRAACRSTCCSGTWCRRTRPPSSKICCAGSIRATAAKTPIYTPEGEWSYVAIRALAGEHGRDGVAALGQRAARHRRRRLPAHVSRARHRRACTRCATASASSSARELPIGRDGRNRPSLFPFCTATGRNAQAKSLFNAHAGMRSFMVFPPDKIGVYLDWRTQEVGIAAALSGDPGADGRLRGW